MSTHYSYNEFHLGDNLVHLHFLRKLALAYPDQGFTHLIHESHRTQLQPLVEGVTNINLLSDTVATFAGARAAGWRNVWKNADGFWERHPLKNQYADFYIQWFSKLAAEMRLSNPIRSPRDLLLDYPAIGRVTPGFAMLIDGLAESFDNGGMSLTEVAHTITDCWFDFLICNSQPNSGQFRAFDSTEYLNPLIFELAAKYRVITTAPVLRGANVSGGDVAGGTHGNHGPEAPCYRMIPCTQDYHLSLTEIGTLSLRCKYFLGIATGPLWPTLNVHNVESMQLRVLLLDCGEVVDYAPNTVQCNTRQLARELLVERGLLS